MEAICRGGSVPVHQRPPRHDGGTAAKSFAFAFALWGWLSACGSSVAPARDAGAQVDAARVALDASAHADQPAQPPSNELTCANPGSYNASNWSGQCGTQVRWSIMTGADVDASQVSLVPVDTTVAALGALPRPATLPPDHRVAPLETTTYRLRNVQLITVNLQRDSDYHATLSDGPNLIRVEFPFPACVSPQSRFGCFITRARGAIDGRFTPGTVTTSPNETVTVVGIGFFDAIAGESYAAPNGVELHPVLGICFGRDCTL
jgi:hypothetical protein